MNTKSKHTKHADILRSDRGEYARSELAFIGAPCSVIQGVSEEIIKALGDRYNIGYVDADHKAFDSPPQIPFMRSGASKYLLDKQSALGLNELPAKEKFDRYRIFDQEDLVLVNGNHFGASNQVVFLDERKTESLKKRLNRLTNVVAIIHATNEAVFPDGFEEQVPNWQSLPKFHVDDLSALNTWIGEWMISQTPPLKVLLLAGGKSTRMGTDKALIRYSGEEQIVELASLMNSFSDHVFLSCRREQEFDFDLPRIYDVIDGMGPMGAILSAFRHDPDAAWMVIACDLPFLDEGVIRELIQNRSVKNIATAFNNQKTGFAEPLITIWEPKSYSRLLYFMSLGYSCPRKVLINSDTRLIQPSDSHKLKNVNTPEEYKEVLQELGKS